jgi:phage baseplate assembly protein W
MRWLSPKLEIVGNKFATTDNKSDMVNFLLYFYTGERPFKSDYGNNLHRLIQNPLPLRVDDLEILETFRTVLNFYAGRYIQLKEFQFFTDPQQNRILDINIVWEDAQKVQNFVGS